MASRDGDVPEWNGEHHTFQEFEERCYWYRRGLKVSDRPLAVARIVRKLHGPAWALTRRLNKHRLNSKDGLEYLLRRLRQHLLLPQVQDIGRHIKAYFEDLRCKRGESIPQYCNRERLVYSDMCKAIGSLRQEPDRERRELGRQEEEKENEGWDDVDDSAAEDQKGHGKGFYKGYGKGYGKAPSEWSSVQGDESDISELQEDTDLLPTEVQGYFLLTRSGLSTEQQREVQAAAKNSLARRDVEQALRALYWDRKPTGRAQDERQGHVGFWDPVDDEAYTDVYDFDHTYADYDETGGDEEWYEDDHDDYDNFDDEPIDFEDDDDKQAYLGAMETMKTGMAQVKQAQRTMSQARALMKDIKVGRGYHYPSKGKSKGTGKIFKGSYKGKSKGKSKGKDKGKTVFKGAKGSSRSDDTCLHCGARGHWARDCPQRARAAHWSSTDYDGYNFLSIRMGMVAEPHSVDTLPYQPGHAYLDCGATDSFGGIEAVEDYARLCEDLNYTGAIRNIDDQDRPKYTFGDGAVQKMMFRADLGIEVNGKAGTLGVHVVDTGKVPLLIGMGALRKLDATVNFRTGACILGAIDPHTVRLLPRAPTGHLVLDLTKDLAEQGTSMGSVWDLSDHSASCHLASVSHRLAAHGSAEQAAETTGTDTVVTRAAETVAEPGQSDSYAVVTRAAETVYCSEATQSADQH